MTPGKAAVKITMPFLIGTGSFTCCAMMTPCLPLLAQYSDQEGHSSYGKSFGLVNATYSVGLLMGPGMGGLLAESFSFAVAAMVYSGMLVVLGMMIYKIGYSSGASVKVFS